MLTLECNSKYCWAKITSFIANTFLVFLKTGARLRLSLKKPHMDLDFHFNLVRTNS